MGTSRCLMLACLALPLLGCGAADPEEPDFQTKSARLSASAGRGAEACASDHECGERGYCKFPAGQCGHEEPGVCSEPPVSCPADVDAVCGCDGATYRNRCTAALAGVSVLREGECPPPPGEGLPSTEPWFCYGKLAPGSPCMLYAFGSEEECAALFSCDPFPEGIATGPLPPSPEIAPGECCVHVHAVCVTECQQSHGCTGVGDCVVVRSAGDLD